MGEEREEERPKKPLVYEDKKTGDVLYGFSQTNLNKVYRMLWVLVILLGVFLLIVLYVVYKVETWDIVGKYIRNCVC